MRTFIENGEKMNLEMSFHSVCLWGVARFRLFVNFLLIASVCSRSG